MEAGGRPPRSPGSGDEPPEQPPTPGGPPPEQPPTPGGTPPEQPPTPGTGGPPAEEPPPGDWPTGDYSTEDYPDLPPEERERRRIPRSRRPPPRTHRRHRDLPAKVRRRQAVAGAVVVGLVAIGGVLLFSGGDDDGDAPEPKQLTPGQLVGQTIIGGVGRSGPSKKLLARVRKGQLGGVIVRPRNERVARITTTQLQRAATAGDNPPLLIMIDQEGGPVKRLPGPPSMSPAQLGQSGDTAAAQTEGEQTGAYLSGLGINVDLAPVADVAKPDTAQTISERTFGTDPARVAELVVAFADGLGKADVAAAVKHFPGLGFASANTDFSGDVTIRASQREIEADLTPFSAAIDSGVQMVMLSNAIYPTYGSADPAAWSTPIVNGELRERLGFNGVIVTDDLESAATKAVAAPAEAAVLAIGAGVDMVLFAKSESASAAAYRALSRRAASGKLPRSTLEDAYERITDMKETYAAAPAEPAAD